MSNLENSEAKPLNYKEIIERDGFIVQLTTGTSMRPMLVQKQDTVIIKKIDRKPKVNDVVLYLTDSGKYVLHRIIKVKKDGYVIRGDNNYFNEYNITDKHIFGILECFYKKDKLIDCNKSFKYKLYVQFNRRTYYIRYVCRAVRNRLGRLKSNLFKK